LFLIGQRLVVRSALLVRNPSKPRKPTLASLWAALLWKTYAQPTVWNETPIPRLGTA